MHKFSPVIVLLALFLLGCSKDDNSPSNRPPDNFQLLQVDNNAIDISLNPQLIWESALDPDGDTVTYTLLLEQGQTNPSTIISSNLEATNFTITTSLQHNTTYSWQVIATDSNGGKTNSEIYTFKSRKLNQTQATPNAAFSTRTEHGLIEFNDRLWIIGGYHASNGGVNGGLLNDVWSSFDGINWTEEVPNNSPTSFTPRTNHTTLVFQNKIWVISGGGTASLLNDVWSSPDGITWTQETASANFPARYAHTSVVFDNRLWVIGGRSQSSSYLNDVWSSTDGNNWNLETNNAAFMPRGFHSSGVFQEKIWVIGGYVSGNTNDIWSSSDGVNWVEETPNGGFSERRGQSTTIYKNRIWVIAGYLNNDVWSSEDGINWNVEIPSADFNGRGDQANVVFNDKLWIAGGWMGSLLNDVWYLD